MSTRDELFNFMNKVIEGEDIKLNDESKRMAIALGIEYNYFRKGGSFDVASFKEALIERYEMYLDLYKLKGKRFDELSEESMQLVLGCMCGAGLTLKGDPKIVPYCSYSVTIGLLGGLLMNGRMISSYDPRNKDKISSVLIPNNDSVILETWL